MMADLLHLLPWEKFNTEECAYAAAGLAQMDIRKLVLGVCLYEKELRTPGTLAELAAQLAPLQLCFRSAHGLWWANNDLNWPDEAGRRVMIQVQAEYIRRAAALGCDTFVLHPGVVYPRYTRPALWEAARRSVEDLLPLAEQSGMILALENNLEYNLGDNSAELAGFIESFQSPYLGACLDVGHANIRESIESSVAALAPYVVTSHLHDNDGLSDRHWIPGRGNIDFHALRERLLRMPKLRHFESEAAVSNPGESLAACTAFKHLFDRGE